MSDWLKTAIVAGAPFVALELYAQRKDPRRRPVEKQPGTDQALGLLRSPLPCCSGARVDTAAAPETLTQNPFMGIAVAERRLLEKHLPDVTAGRAPDTGRCAVAWADRWLAAVRAGLQAGMWQQARWSPLRPTSPHSDSIDWYDVLGLGGVGDVVVDRADLADAVASWLADDGAAATNGATPPPSGFALTSMGKRIVDVRVARSLHAQAADFGVGLNWQGLVSAVVALAAEMGFAGYSSVPGLLEEASRELSDTLTDPASYLGVVGDVAGKAGRLVGDAIGGLLLSDLGAVAVIGVAGYLLVKR